MIVKVVSKQLESVRVEQNHCQGLMTVKKSYRGTGESISIALKDQYREGIPLNAMSATYSSPSLDTPSSIDAFTQLPCVIVAQCCDDGLCDFWRSEEELTMGHWAQLIQLAKSDAQAVDGGKQNRMDSGA